MDKTHIKKAVHWTFTGLTVILVISGLGITQFRIVEAVTFGLLTKSLAFTVHNYLTIPFILLLAVHIFMAIRGKK